MRQAYEKLEENAVKRTQNRNEPKHNTIETVHKINNVNKGSSKIYNHLMSLYKYLKYPVVSVGIIRWVERTVSEVSVAAFPTIHC